MRVWDSQETEKFEQCIAWVAKVLAGAGLALFSRWLRQWLATRALPKKLAFEIMQATDETLRGTVEATANQLRVTTELHAKSEQTTEVRFTEVRNDICTLRTEMNTALSEIRRSSYDQERRQDERIDKLIQGFHSKPEETK